MPLTEDAKRQESPAILFDPISASAGEDVTIYARVHNFSLIDTSGAIRVKFYAGDPAMGAQPLISSTTGNDFATIATTIPARGATVVSFDWTIPASTNVNALRMYARIDPDDTIDEIHEDNNTDWSVILPVPLPEPSAALLRVAGLVALAALARRRGRTRGSRWLR